MYGRISGVYFRSYTNENLTKAAPAPEIDMLVDISPDSPYYVTRDADITWHDSSVYDNNTYELHNVVHNTYTYNTRHVVIDLTDLMAKMANPVIIAYFGTYANQLRYNNDWSNSQLRFYDENGTLIASSWKLSYINQSGYVLYIENGKRGTANLAPYKTLKTILGIVADTRSNGDYDVHTHTFLSSYIGLCDVKS